jgi:hypothetical protein
MKYELEMGIKKFRIPLRNAVRNCVGDQFSAFGIQIMAPNTQHRILYFLYLCVNHKML